MIKQLSRVSPLKKKSYMCHIWLALFLNLVEQASLIGVTYVSNRENYRKCQIVEYKIPQTYLHFFSHFHNSYS